MRFSTCLRTIVVVAVLGMLARSALAQAPEKRKLRMTTTLGLRQLPSPLERVTGNLHELEKNGILSVTDVSIDTVGIDRQDAIVWTLRVNRLVTCRSVAMFLEAFRDVRFYYETKQALIEVHTARLYYDEMVKTGADNAERLPRDSVVQAYIFLNVGDLARIQRGDPNQIVFSRSGENLFRNLDQIKPEKKSYKVPEHALVKKRAGPGRR